MTIESGQRNTEKSRLQRALLEIAAEIDFPVNKWEKKWMELAEMVGNTPEEIEERAREKRPKLIK